MKRTIITLILFLVALTGYTQDWEYKAPDYKQIGEKVKEESSELYYPKLMKRYQDADTTMTLEERRHLYYGYIFEPDYSPYGRSDYTDSLKVLLNKPDMISNDLDILLSFSDSVLAQDPFDLRVMNYQVYAYEQKNDSTSAAKQLARMNMVIDALVSSGTGLEKATAFYVIKVGHEYDLLNILGMSFGGTQRLIEHFDYLSVKENETGIEGLYFDISPSLEHLSKMFK
ncbi:DUF4919 domain-containing protein [Robertkochia solimangrovi]|uniref:DUF4919 domain-containing protein n=1 Tax=Robertkochia solimangrovi TaxID=2213046 RepID=UPI0011816CCA|nr:DUF4919 domain-containing protein [Robertkochia solimangrovi]TRZ43184.1 hypothetical protein DMZ48_10855 [Robertkochia solimangrovi]